jgi:hypothetical protein
MEMATTVYEQYYDFLEAEKLLLPTNGLSPLAQESFAFTNELPADKVTQTTQCWGYLESQESTAVSPDTFGEFVFPYQQRLVDRFGLLSYGCCERVDDIWPDYLSKWSNLRNLRKLRKLSVAPFNKRGPRRRISAWQPGGLLQQTAGRVRHLRRSDERRGDHDLL